MKKNKKLAITFIAAVMGVISINSFVSLLFAQPIVGLTTYCHNEKSGTNFVGPCPGQSAKHNTNLQQKTCVLGPSGSCPPNLKDRD